MTTKAVFDSYLHDVERTMAVVHDSELTQSVFFQFCENYPMFDNHKCWAIIAVAIGGLTEWWAEGEGFGSSDRNEAFRRAIVDLHNYDLENDELNEAIDLLYNEWKAMGWHMS